VPRGSLLDAGCGSGVLAVGAARLGFAPVFGLDHDPAAVEAAERTARANGVRVGVSAADVLTDDLPPVDVVVANIELRAVEALLARRPAATAVTSGYLVADTPSAADWRHSERVELAGWAADVFLAK
jgi:ribosomal protein L11 methyltransferase